MLMSCPVAGDQLIAANLRSSCIALRTVVGVSTLDLESLEWTCDA